MSPIRKQNKTLEKEQNEVETNKLPNAEFKTLVIRKLNDLSKNFCKKLGNIKMETKIQRRSQN